MLSITRENRVLWTYENRKGKTHVRGLGATVLTAYSCIHSRPHIVSAEERRFNEKGEEGEVGKKKKKRRRRRTTTTMTVPKSIISLAGRTPRVDISVKRKRKKKSEESLVGDLLGSFTGYILLGQTPGSFEHQQHSRRDTLFNTPTRKCVKWPHLYTPMSTYVTCTQMHALDFPHIFRILCLNFFFVFIFSFNIPLKQMSLLFKKKRILCVSSMKLYCMSNVYIKYTIYRI